MCLTLNFSQVAFAGGGGIVTDKDQCILDIDFYRAHLTIYQPGTNGSKEFCQSLPGIEETIFVLDYMHDSLRDVPVDFKIIRDITGLGKFVRWKDVQNLANLEPHTVFYRPPGIETGGSYRVRYTFTEKGNYIGIVSAGHPSNGKIYYSAFPFSVGKNNYRPWMFGLFTIGLLALLARHFYVRRSRANSKQDGELKKEAE